mmetsp:Transcript_1422/g.2813  ORF Transcript_1422/g.2813 Transcript_1422/m.2813 type:complete len:314 (-) Transcript_1422:880-1821(-)
MPPREASADAGAMESTNLVPRSIEMPVAGTYEAIAEAVDVDSLKGFRSASDAGGSDGARRRRRRRRQSLIEGYQLRWLVRGTILAVMLLVVAGVVAMFMYPAELCRSLAVGCRSFDYVIIGAGPAGSVVAHHLSSDAVRARVLVLEAGGPSQRATGGSDFLYNNLTVFDVPLAWSYVAHLGQYHWDMGGDAIIAKVVGGCGVHNAMLYVRALPENIESWNMSEWQWKDIYDQYLALEHFQGSGETTKWHSMGGPMMTSAPIFKDLLGKKFLETTKNLGMPFSRDFNIPNERVGAGYYHFNIRHGVRASINLYS